ncbi:MAG: hypothetical protein R2828_10425 [Saprospiraceae bacterium]
MISDIDNLEIGNFLASSEYERIAIRQGFGDAWQKASRMAQSNRMVFMVGHDHKPGDSKDAFILLMDSFYRTDQDLFDKFVYSSLKGFVNWNYNEIELDNIFEDLKLLEFPGDWLTDLYSIYLEKVRLILNNKKLDAQLNPEDVDEEFLIKENELLKAQKRSWIQQLSKAEIEKVIDQILEYATKTDDSALLEKIINQSSRFHRIKNKVRDGTINFDTETLEVNKVNKALIALIEGIS